MIQLLNTLDAYVVHHTVQKKEHDGVCQCVMRVDIQDMLTQKEFTGMDNKILNFIKKLGLVSLKAIVGCIVGIACVWGLFYTIIVTIGFVSIQLGFPTADLTEPWIDSPNFAVGATVIFIAFFIFGVIAVITCLYQVASKILKNIWEQC